MSSMTVVVVGVAVLACAVVSLGGVQQVLCGASGSFGIKNGTRQGPVASPAFWSVYLDPLFAQLCKSGFGCHIGGVFVGVVGYADDLLLLAPTRDSAQKMLKIC